MNGTTTIIEADTLLMRKHQTLKQRADEVAVIERNVARMGENGEVVPRGCGICSLLFGRRGVDKSIVRNATAATKLQQTGEAVRARLSTLQQRLDGMRAEARRLAKEGKKAEALSVLKRSKAIEKQVVVAQTTADALDTQILVLEEAALQKEVSAALGASVKAVRKKTKHLLKDTENAVDGAADVRDLTEDLNGALEGLRPADGLDEDDLLAELDELVAGQASPAELAEEAAVAATVATAPRREKTNGELPTVHEVEAAAVGIEVGSYPSVPAEAVATKRQTKREERAQLLSSQHSS